MPDSAAPEPGRNARFRVRRGVRAVLLVIAMAIMAPFLRGYGAVVTAVTSAVLLILAVLVAERCTRAVFVRDGELVVRKRFRVERVSLHSLTELRADKVRSGSGTHKSDFTRFTLTDQSGRRLRVWARDVADGEQLARTFARWAQRRRLGLDAQTQGMLRFEAGGGLGGIFRDTGRLLWRARQQSRRR